MSDLSTAIQNELAGLSNEDLIARLTKLREKKTASRTLTKEQRTANYIKARGEEGSAKRAQWDRKRKEQAEKRKKAKDNALLKFAIEQLGVEKVKELGFRIPA